MSRNYYKMWSKLESGLEAKIKSKIKAFHIYKEVYTINLCHVYKPPQQNRDHLKNAMDTHQKGKCLYRSVSPTQTPR